MAVKTTQVNIRVDANLLERFKRTCRENSTTVSDELRRLMAERVAGLHEDVGSLSRMLDRIGE